MHPRSRSLTSSASTFRTSVALGRYVFIVRDPQGGCASHCSSFCYFASPWIHLHLRSSLRRCFTFQGDLEGDPDCIRLRRICQEMSISSCQKSNKQRHLSESWPNSRTTMAVPQRFAQLPSTTAPLRQRAALRDTVARLARTPRGPLWLRSGRAARFLTESSVLKVAFIELWRVG